MKLVFAKRKLPPAEAVVVTSKATTRDPVVPTLLQGKVFFKGSRSSRNPIPVALSVIKNRAVLQFTSHTKRAVGTRTRVVSLKMRIGARGGRVQARVSTKPQAMFAGKECASSAIRQLSDQPKQMLAAADVQASGFELYRIITLSTDADKEWYARYGDESNAEIAAIINAAEAVYQEQLGIRFAIVRQHVYADVSPYVSTDASLLLTSFRKNPENPANLGMLPQSFDQDVDAKYLFTGKDLDGSTVGLSYVGAMCWSPKDAYGLVQDASREINVPAFLHEMGHTLGAQHDQSDSNGIMFPQLGVNRRYFSTVSVAQMTRHLSSFGKCIDEQMLRPNLTNAALTVKRTFSRDRKRVIIKGSLLSPLGKPLAGEQVKLTLNQRETVVVTTNALGIFKYSVQRNKVSGKRLLVLAQPARDESYQPAAIKIPLRA